MSVLSGAVIGAMLALSVSRAPCFANVELAVVALPDTPIVDMTKPLPPVRDAIIEVAELGRVMKADQAGVVHFRLPLDDTCRERAYTFVATTKSSPHQSVLRRVYGPGTQRLQMFFDPKRDLYNDASFKEPPKTIVTITVTDRRGVFPVPGATVRIKDLNLVAKTDEHGEAELIVPLGGPWTFEVTGPGAESSTVLRTEVPERGSSRFLIRMGTNRRTEPSVYGIMERDRRR